MTAATPGLRAWLARSFDRPTPLVKQFATVGGVLAAFIILAAFDDINITNHATAWTGVALVVVSTILAVLLPSTGS